MKPYMEATHVEDGTFSGGDEDAFNVGFKDGETVVVCKKAFFGSLVDRLRKLEAANMKPDGHFWDHTSKEYREMLASKEPEVPDAS